MNHSIKGALLTILLASPCAAETAVHQQVRLAGKYVHNLDCIDRSGDNYHVDCTGTWTTPSTLLRTDIVRFVLRAAGGGGAPYNGSAGGGGRLNVDFTDLPPGVVFTFQAPGAGRGSGLSMSGQTQGGHVWIKYNDPDNPAHPQFTYSSNGGRPDHSSGGGRGGQGCDDESGGCSEGIDPHVLLESFLPDGGGDGSPAHTFSAGTSGPIGNGNAGGNGGQNSPLGAGFWGAGGGSVGPGGLSCAPPCNAGGQDNIWGYQGNGGLLSVEIKPGI